MLKKSDIRRWPHGRKSKRHIFATYRMVEGMWIETNRNHHRRKANTRFANISVSPEIRRQRIVHAVGLNQERKFAGVDAKHLIPEATVDRMVKLKYSLPQLPNGVVSIPARYPNYFGKWGGKEVA